MKNINFLTRWGGKETSNSWKRVTQVSLTLVTLLIFTCAHAWGTDFDITLDQFRTTPISGLVKIDDSNLSLSGGALQLSSGNKNFIVSTTNSDYKIKEIVFTTSKAVISYGGDPISENTFTPASPGTSFTLNLAASGGTAKITQMVVTLTTSTSETLEALLATAITDGVYTTGSSVITLSTEGGTCNTTSGQEYINLAKSKSTRSLTIATSSSYNIKFIALAFYDAIFSRTITASTGTYTAASYIWTPGATPSNSVTLTFGTENSEGAKIRRVLVGYESAAGGCTPITPTWSTDYSSTTLNVGATSSTPVVGKDGSSGAVTFSSSDTYIATVNSSGVVTGVGAGTATITATVAADGGKCAGTVTKEFTIKAGVTYDANSATGGSVPTDDNTYAYNANITVAGNTGSLYKTGFVFNGWNTRSDGTGTHYEAGATMKMPSKSTGVTLYAEWVGYATSWEWWNSGQSNNSTTFTYITGKNYICSFASSGSTAVASWDITGTIVYRGVKMKTKDHYMYFWVPTGKRVSITFGYMSTKPTFTVGGVNKAGDLTTSTTDSATVTYTTTADTKFYIENETATNTAFTVKSVKIEDDAPSCTAPNHVDITGTNKYLGGQTISLTATAYSSAGTGSPIDAGDITGYQWQKEINSVWTDLENGGNISGATTNNLQISSCAHGNAGQYRCVVSTGATCSTASSAYGVHVFSIHGAYYEGEYSDHEIVWSSGTTGTATIHLNASSTYMFKVWSNDGYYYGNGSGNYIIQPINWDCGTGNQEMRLLTGPEGDYTFTVDIENALDNDPYVNVQVGYPSVTHPSTGYIYLSKWWDCYVHYWYNNDNVLSPWGSDPQISTYTNICGTDYWYFPVVDYYCNFIAKDNAGDPSNTTGDQYLGEGGSNGGKLMTHNGVSWGWQTFTFYTISFAGNGNTGGSMSDITGICSGADQALTANAFEKTGYTFNGWKDASSNDYADEATISNITANIALTAQWTAKSCTVTFDIEGGTGTISNVTATYGSAMPSKATNLPEKTGYTFGGFWDGDNGTGTKYYNANGTSAQNWDKNTTSTTTLYAKWTANTPTITLDDQDATNTPTGSVVATYGSAMPSIATLPTKTGYTFSGFYSDVAGGGTKYYNADGSSAKNSDLASEATLYALWTQTVTLHDNRGGSNNGSVSVTYKGTAGTPSAPSAYSGHTQDGGYYAESSCTNKVMALDGTLQTSVTDGSSVVWTNSSSKWAHAGASILYAHWKCNTPTITDNGDNTVTISVPSGATVYYTTDGSTPDDGDTEYTDAFTIDADCTVKAIAIQSGCTSSDVASADCKYVAPGPSYTAPTSALDISAQTSVTAAALITAQNATQSHYLSTNTDTLLLIPSDIYYNIGNGKKNTWATANGSPANTSADWSRPAGSVSFKGRTWWKSGGNINTLQVRSDRTLNIRVKGCKTVSVLNAAASSTKYFIMEAYEYDDGYKSSDPDVNASNTSTSVTETSLSLNSSKEYVVVLRGNTEDNNKVYEIKFIAPSSGYTVSIAANPAGYGTVSSSSVTSVASGTTLSTSTNTLSVGATNVTATPADASAEYTYAFSNWTKSDGTALPSTVTADLSVYANFTRTENNYTLAWSSNGGSELSGDYTSGSTAYGASITAPNDPTLSNYAFDGWKTNNDGTGTTAGATMPAANTTYYAAWKQTVTLKTGTQGSGADKTPYVYINGTGVNSFTAHTADGYTLQGYYTAGSGGTKVLNADGTFAGSNVTDYITSSKWSRTGAAPTLYAQWVASEDCSTSDFVIKKGSDTQYQGCMESSSYDGTATSFTAGSPTTVGKAKMTISSYSKGAITRPGSGNTFSIVIEPVSGYYLKSICWAGKVESGETVSYYWDDNSGSATTISAQTTSGTGVTYNAPSSTTKFTASYVDDGVDGGGIWWRNVQVEVCAAGGTTYNVTYDGNDETDGTAPTDDTDYSYGGTVTVKDNGTLEKDNYTFAGWATANNGTGSNYVEDNTFSITGNTTLYAKWTQAVTFDANTGNHGSTGGSATAIWNATGLTGITHATPASGYKLLGYYTAATEGTKVLNSDGSFAATNVTDYITSGKWSRTGAAPTLYAQYESAGALTWNLIVNSDTTNLSTSTKTSAFTEISTTNMTDAALTGLTYSKGKKSSLTGKISTPASYDADKYVYVTFQVASGYKFTPSSIKVIAQPVTTGKDVKLSLTDGASHSLVSSSATSISGGSTQTVTLAGDGTYFIGTVTLKIYCYGATDAYRLGTPITIEGEVEEACATMPDYSSMSYTTTTFAPNADASGSPITIVGGENINTYQWKYNTTNDRTSGTNCGTNDASLTPLTDAGAATDVTRYYWCEMTNTACGLTIKSPAVAITVAEAKSNATVTWTNPASTPNYGGGGYTIKATVNQTGWDGDAADLVITAPAGIRIYSVTSGTTSSQKWVQADFDVQTSFDRTTYASNIPFTVSAAATSGYNAISDDHNVSYSACSGGGSGSSYNIRVRKSYDKDASNNYRWVTPGAGEITYAVGSSISSGKAGTAMATVFDSIMSSDKQYIWVKTFVDNIKQMRLYVETSGANVSVSALYQRTTYAAADAKDVITGYSVVYDEDDDAENTGTKGQHTIDLIFTSALSANDIICVKFSSSKVKALGAAITEGSAGSLNTYLQWSDDLADGATVAKNTTDAYFTYSASKSTENTNSLGAITYSSSNTSAATVDATGKVALVAAGETTIKATLAASGCYKKAEISYTLNVTEVPCAITAGTLTLTSGSETKCEDDEVTLTLTGFESGASIQWKDGDTDINNGGDYEIATDGTTITLTTDQEGTYSVMVTKDCSVRSNRITISNKSTEVGAKRIVKDWYIKNGRPTPDIELWTLQNGAHLSSVAWSPVNATGLTASDFYESDGKVYLKGKEPSANESGADINYTLTLTVEDDCGSTTDMDAAGQLIYLHHQKNTDKHVLAFVVNGTNKGGFTEGITAAQTTSVPLYNEIAANFDVLATNIRSTDDEQALKEYYSQFDILCITDYPSTGDKGANSKSYVDAIGALIDIRPILTMEAFVSKLANWKAKGISGNPMSPTTRQYSMLLQCKDHEIFSGTKLTKEGEGDETMYRVSMVDNSKADYATLDGYTPGSKDYDAGGKPALQGFTFTKEMSEGLLPLGEIDDGAGNELQVGIERQAKMEARLMVLGINSYAMERLTDDGQTVVINALKYLMKKNSEDIADCSNTFVGGDDEEDESTRYNWNVDAHWMTGSVPDRTQKVRIVAPCVVPDGQTVHVAGVVIAPTGEYNGGANKAKGSLTIAAGGALVVDGTVEAANAPYYTVTRATSVEDLYIHSTSSGTGALVMGSHDGTNKATVEFYSIGRKNGSNKKIYQYIGTPFNDVDDAQYNYYGSWMYQWNNSSYSWTKLKNGDGVEEFMGYSISQPSTSARTYLMQGTLVSSDDVEKDLVRHEVDGKPYENMFANSWMAPISLAAMDEEDFGGADATIYIFNAGSDADNAAGGGGWGSSAGQTTAVAGQYTTAPIKTSGWMDVEGNVLTVIPSMQAFSVAAPDAGDATLTLNYNKHVLTPALTSVSIQPNRAPSRRMARNGRPPMLRLFVRGATYSDQMWMFMRNDFSEGFDNGYDGRKMVGDSKAPQLYATTTDGNMTIHCTPEADGTMLGFQPGQDASYTFSFIYDGDETLYLNDLKTQTSTLIAEGETYTFTCESGDEVNRFMISVMPFGGMPSGLDESFDKTDKVQKVIYKDHVYIIRGGKIYGVDGTTVK